MRRVLQEYLRLEILSHLTERSFCLRGVTDIQSSSCDRRYRLSDDLLPPLPCC